MAAAFADMYTMHAQAEEQEGALTACMERVADLQRQLAAAMEGHEKAQASQERARTSEAEVCRFEGSLSFARSCVIRNNTSACCGLHYMPLHVHMPMHVVSQAAAMAALQARHAQEVAGLAEALEAATHEKEGALGKLRREQEAERERVKRAIAEMKRKLDRCTPMQGLRIGLPGGLAGLCCRFHLATMRAEMLCFAV